MFALGEWAIRWAYFQDPGDDQLDNTHLMWRFRRGVLRERVPERRVVTRQDVIVAGMRVAAEVFRAVDANVKVDILVPDGEGAAAGATLLRVSGSARALLTAERTALNFAQRMTAIATATKALTRMAGDDGPLILDTRKTAPGLRRLDKYAVACGGGANNRMGLHY